VKKVLLTALCAALVVSCASKRAAFVDSTIVEAKTLNAVAKTNSLEGTAPIEVLIIEAEKESDAGQTEKAFILADEAVLQFQIALQEQENKKMTDSLKIATESLNIIRNFLAERKKGNK
jgi:hypothetical protein